MNAVAGSSALLVFTRTPVAGEVKTRLLPVLDAERAAAVHTRLLLRTLETARNSTVTDIELWCAPTAQHPVLIDLAQRFGLSLQTQVGADLGARMCFALEQTLRRYGQVALIGSDCIDLSATDIDLAMARLITGADVALGPAQDGGYYLIGMANLHRQLFTGIKWGTDAVLRETRRQALESGLRLTELPVRRDLDRPEDLRYL